MLSFLLDENISPEVARQIAKKRPCVTTTSVHCWHEARFIAACDKSILTAAAQEGLTLVTYDQKTFLPLLVQWGRAHADHAGVVFVDEHAISSSDLGALVRALTAFWDDAHLDDWPNRVVFLHAPDP